MKMVKNLLVSVILSSMLGFSSLATAAQVNVNKASAEEISDNLSGIGMVKAQRIVEYCQENSCVKPEDLMNVKGVGVKTIEKNRDNLKFSESM
ncbi:ComEA family DNA-binding protein [Thiomicrorhabdus indica]|uniref:ComEA family DNA-binding protein n=1 Tax=Thiomicrorhabdus indica TaxID=2267253 RepID=UPI001F0EE8A0|nr:helix-hairpin-helix domain-containing protein [Thiomicrorhabdus indica]